MEKTVNIELSLKQQEEVLVANRDFIIKHLDADDVIDELIQARLIGKNAAQRIGLVTMSRIDKNRIIFDQLSIAGPGALKKFCDILKKDERQTFIAVKVEQCKLSHGESFVIIILHYSSPFNHSSCTAAMFNQC